MQFELNLLPPGTVTSRDPISTELAAQDDLQLFVAHFIRDENHSGSVIANIINEAVEIPFEALRRQGHQSSEYSTLVGAESAVSGPAPLDGSDPVIGVSVVQTATDQASVNASSFLAQRISDRVEIFNMVDQSEHSKIDSDPDLAGTHARFFNPHSTFFADEILRSPSGETNSISAINSVDNSQAAVGIEAAPEASTPVRVTYNWEPSIPPQIDVAEKTIPIGPVQPLKEVDGLPIVPENTVIVPKMSHAEAVPVFAHAPVKITTGNEQPIENSPRDHLVLSSGSAQVETKAAAEPTAQTAPVPLHSVAPAAADSTRSRPRVQEGEVLARRMLPDRPAQSDQLAIGQNDDYSDLPFLRASVAPTDANQISRPSDATDDPSPTRPSADLETGPLPLASPAVARDLPDIRENKLSPVFGPEIEPPARTDKGHDNPSRAPSEPLQSITSIQFSKLSADHEGKAQSALFPSTEQIAGNDNMPDPVGPLRRVEHAVLPTINSPMSQAENPTPGPNNMTAMPEGFERPPNESPNEMQNIVSQISPGLTKEGTKIAATRDAIDSETPISKDQRPIPTLKAEPGVVSYVQSERAAKSSSLTEVTVKRPNRQSEFVATVRKPDVPILADLPGYRKARADVAPPVAKAAAPGVSQTPIIDQHETLESAVERLDRKLGPLDTPPRDLANRLVQSTVQYRASVAPKSTARTHSVEGRFSPVSSMEFMAPTREIVPNAEELTNELAPQFGLERIGATIPTGTATGFSPSQAIGHSLQMGQAIARQITNAVGAGALSGPIELTLDPPELGNVRITAIQCDIGVTLQVYAERQDTLDLMRRHADVLEREFRDQGLDTADFDFSGGRDDQDQSTEDAPSNFVEQPEDRQTSIETIRIHAGSGLDIRI